MQQKDNLTIELLWYWQGPAARYYIPNHAWRSSSEISCWYLRRGTVKLLWEDGQQQASAGSVIIPPPLRRNEVFSANAEVQSMRISAFDNEYRMLVCPHKPLIYKNREALALREHFTAIERIISESLGMDTGRKTYIQDIALDLRTLLRLRAILSTFFETLLEKNERQQRDDRNAVPQHRAVAEALNYLSKRDLHTPLKELDVAAQIGISLPHLRRLFREQIGVTIKEWDSHRLSASVKRALGTNKPCKAIAFEHGFCTPSHFSHWFQERFGCSPTQWQSKAVIDDIV